MSEPILEVRDLSVTFPRLGLPVQAVRHCHLSLGQGEVLGLVGESGSGKSMASLACLGLVPAPGQVQGQIFIEGQNIVGQSEQVFSRIRGRRIGMIFQNPSTALNPFFTVGHQVSDVIRLHREADKQQARRLAMASFAQVRLPDPEQQFEKYPHQLSGGQLQRVVIAMALACQPKVLIADEPTTALDVTIQAQILVLLRELVATVGLSILFITHDLGVVATLCDRVAVMYAGTVVEEGEVETLFAAPSHPYTQKLMETVPMLGRGRGVLPFIAGQVPDMSYPPSGCAFHPRCDVATALCQSEPPPVRWVTEGHRAVCHHAVAADGELR